MGLLSILTRSVRVGLPLLAATACLMPAPRTFAAATDLADQPMFVTNNVPPNMMLVLSVEWPTGVVAAYMSNYAESSRYLGYFDPERCYGYFKGNGATRQDKPVAPGTNRDATVAAGEYFAPTGTGTGSYSHQCSGAFSGNYLNWAAMHALDEFRFAMTGGDRVVDTTTRTVVEKTRHTGNGGYTQFPIKSSSSSNINPLGFATSYARVTNGSTELDPWSDSKTRGRVIQISSKSDFTGTTYTYLVRLAVCDASAPGGLEYSAEGDYKPCTDYGVAKTGDGDVEVYKPTGLIQKNASKMRFGVVAYQFDNSSAHAKGVLRARIKSLGPKLAIPMGNASNNANAEWDSSGILFANPDSADALASKVSQSGTINYLNKFGKANGYESYDTLGELYYAGLRALRNLPPPADYISGLTAGSAAYDGFPIITTVVDDSDLLASLPARPIQYSCQQNNLVGIADTNTHTDVALPGNTLAGYANHPTGGNIKDDPANIDVTVLTNKVGVLEGLGSSLGTTYQSSARTGTFHLAGLAYWANTKDILIDNPQKPWTVGNQTAQTYWVDVRESGGQGKVNNQMWLAAKYGGFSDINGNGVPATISTWHTNADIYTDTVVGPSNPASIRGLRPDNYFTGDQPAVMIASLNSIFNAVLSRSLSSSGASLSTINFQNAGAGAYTVKYNSKDWSGDVLGNTISVDASGIPTVTNVWSAQAKLDTQEANSTFWDTGRRIATTNPALTTASKGVAFRLANLSDTQKTYLGTTTTEQQNLLNYLRGDKTNESVYYRVRIHLLGDIIDSEATVVVGPDGTYKDAYNPGYSSFTKITRASRIYVGAIYGMLHAFSGDVSATQTDGGQEKWAYIPSFVLSGPSGTPAVDGLAARALRTGFLHKYYVDQTPYVRDVDFSRTQGATAAAGGDWHTILVGGLGKGERGFMRSM